MDTAMSTDVYELRVHGVAGTPPEDTLGVPAATLVAGDDRAGFYRPYGPDGGACPPVAGRQVEAYSWSGLTSGGRASALWLLLTPFMLVNVAAFAGAVPLGLDPGHPSPGRTTTRRRRLLESALVLTGL